MFKFKTVILLFAFGLAIGILFALQFRAPARTSDPVASVAALKEAKDVLDTDQISLKKTISDLRAQISNKQNELKDNKKASKELVDQANTLRDKAGITSKKDAGLVVTLADSQTGEPNIDSIVHAADVRDLVNVLWQNKAQAI